MWAERENDRRRRAYRSESDAWRRRRDHLTRLRIEAGGFLGCTQPRTGLPVELADDELIFRVVPDAELVEAEARHVPGLPTPGRTATYAETPDDALPSGLRIIDSGLAVVTNHRVAFAGRDHRREWTYADLLGPAHHPDVPLTLLHTTGRGRLAGLLVPATAVVNLRFYLTLAVATFADERAAVVAQLDDLLSAHRCAEPLPLSLVTPEDAPLAAVRPDRRAVAVTAVATVVFATLTAGAFGSETGSSGGRAEAGTITTADAVVPAHFDEPDRGTPTAGGAATRITGGVPPREVPRPVVPVPTSEPVPLVASVPSAVAVPPAAPVVPSAPAPSASSTPTPGPAPTTPLPTVSATPSAPASPTALPSPSPSSTVLSICLDAFQSTVPCP
ncbi:hypothetical protein [Micromonospora vulcania]|uniref:Uncharacterized protein n=1 Tax=Micromonospora vulcania TaxID=1441873 RepID=A0ABW1H828_9ACTN